VAEILDVPSAWHFVGYFCLGYPQSESDTPELEREEWERRRPATTYLLRR
jgi:5,6-dimethylbenzimidazole synthase